MNATLQQRLWILLAVSSTVGAVAAVVGGFHPLFLMDSWELVELFRIWTERGVGLSDLWAQHNEHRILTLRLILLGDLFWEQGSGVLVLVLIFVLQLLHVGLLARVLGRDERFDSTTRTFFVCLAAILLFWLRQRENFLWTFQVAWILNALAVSGSAYLLAGLIDARTGTPTRLPARLGLAALACLVAATTVASGLLLPGILAVLLWKARVDRTVWIGWGVFTCLLFGTYLFGYTSPAQHSAPSEALAVGTILYLLAYLGNPIALNGIPIPLVVATGAAILGIYVWLAVRFIRSVRPTFLDGFCFVVSTQAVLMATLTAIGRHAMGLEQAAAGRYSTPAILLWFSLAMWGFARSADRPRLQRLQLRALMFATALFVLPTQLLFVPKTLAMYRIHDETSLALMAGVQDTNTTIRAYPYPDRMWELNDIARANALSIYRREWTRWPRSDFRRTVSLDTLHEARAAITERRAAGSVPHAGYFVSGRVVYATGSTPSAQADFVLIRGDSIVGYARSAQRGCDGCFTGYVSGGPGFDLYAVTPRAPGRARMSFVPTVR